MRKRPKRQKKENFGSFIRRQREAKGISLREMAERIGVSPTYLSKIERDQFPPAAEDRVKAIAEIIGDNADELLARAGRVSSDLSAIIRTHPVEIAMLLRTTMGLTTKQISQLANEARQVKAEKRRKRQSARSKDDDAP